MGSWIHDGFLDSRWVPGLMTGSLIHNRFLESRWILGFRMGSWIHDGFSDSRKSSWVHDWYWDSQCLLGFTMRSLGFTIGSLLTGCNCWARCNKCVEMCVFCTLFKCWCSDVSAWYTFQVFASCNESCSCSSSMCSLICMFLMHGFKPFESQET